MVGFCPEHIQRDTKEEGSLFSWHSGWRGGDTNKGWKIRDVFEIHKHFIQGFSGGSVVKNPPANAEDMGLVPGSGSSPGVGWQLTPVFLLGEFHKQRWLVGYSPVQFSRSVVSTPWIAAHQASLSITISRSSLKLTSIESVMPSSHLILCRPLLLLPPIPPSIRVFSNESTFRRRWPKYWSFSFSIISSKEHPGLISFRMDWLDLLAVQGTLKSLLQHHSSKASILWHLAFFTVQLSHPYMTTGKTIALTRWTFVGNVMSLLLNMLYRLVITFLPRSKCLLISWLQSPFAVILEPPKIKSDTFPLFPHLFPMKWWDQMPWSSFSECWALSQLFRL